jgi:hypothetical protein
VFARGIGNDLQYIMYTFNDKKWGSWESLGGQLASEPAAVFVQLTRKYHMSIYVFVQSPENTLWYITRDNLGHWEQWQEIPTP